MFDFSLRCPVPNYVFQNFKEISPSEKSCLFWMSDVSDSGV